MTLLNGFGVEASGLLVFGAMPPEVDDVVSFVVHSAPIIITKACCMKSVASSGGSREYRFVHLMVKLQRDTEDR